MKNPLTAFRSAGRWQLPGGTLLPGACLALALVLGTAGAWAQATVKTLGGGHADRYGQPNGFIDGDTLEAAMFDGPMGLALGPDGNLWFADRNNGAIRKLLLGAGQTRTVMTNFNQPIGIRFDPGDTLYIVTAGDNTIRRYDTNFNLLGTITSALNGPNAFAMDSATNIFVAQGDGSIIRVHPTNAVPAVLAAGFNNPGGVAIMGDGNLAVSDSGNHAIWKINPFVSPATVTLLTGGNGAGLRNGDAGLAQFNSPQGISAAPNGELLVADQLNHQVRLVRTNGYATTFYGILQSSWTSDICVGCGYNGGTVWPGWSDGPYDPTDPLRLYPAARDPISIFVTASGTVYASEWGYHIIRQVTGVDLTAPTGTGGGGSSGGATNVVVQNPTITPDTGYFPNGQIILVGSPNPDVFYTTDGSDPTTNSWRVPMVGNVGFIHWRNAQSDLSDLRVRAWIGTNKSEVVSGKSPTSNSIGPSPSVNTNYLVGPGSSAIVPVVVNMLPDTSIRSIFYTVEVQADPAAPGISDQFRIVTLSTNDFIRVVGVSGNGMTAFPYGDPSGTIGGKRGLLVSAVGTNLGGVITGFGVVNLLSVPIPANAPIGSTYTVRVLAPSASSDGYEAIVPMTTGTTVTIQVGGGGGGGVAGTTRYLVGDSSPSGWYNAGEFGDNNLNIADVNNAFYASLGLKVPPTFSDVFDAMDAFPVDTAAAWGGDGEIRFLDWQVILQRASRVDPNNYYRVREAGGVKTVQGPAPLSGNPDDPATQIQWLPGAIWVKQARLAAESVGDAQPGTTVKVPVYIRLTSDHALSGMSLSAVVRPAGNSGDPIDGVQFIPATPALQPTMTGNTVPGSGAIGNLIYCVWQSFPTVLRGSTLLGWISFAVPDTATAGDVYVVRFLAGSGGDMTVRPWREPKFETYPGFVFVQVPAPPAPVRISDEWRAHFFGNIDSADGELDADPDTDGEPNWREYLAGTSPIRGDSLLKLRTVLGDRRNAAIHWLSAPDKTYVLECTDNLRNGPWTTVTTLTGDGDFKEVELADGLPPVRFYRLRLVP